MLSSWIPTLIIVIKDFETFSNAIQGKIEALVSTSEANFIVAQSKIFDLLSYSQLFNWNNLCTSSAGNSCKLDISVAWFLEIKIKEDFAVWCVSEICADYISDYSFIGLAKNIEF